MRGLIRRTEHSVRRLPKVRLGRVVDVAEGLRVAVDDREPRALDLHHDPVTLAEAVELVAQVELDRRDRTGDEGLGLREAISELAAEHLAGEEHLEVTELRAVGVRRRVAGQNVDQLDDPVGVGAGRRDAQLREDRAGGPLGPRIPRC